MNPVLAESSAKRARVEAPLVSFEFLQPLVAAVAKKVLSVPATSTPSERLFSTARRVSSGDRATLSPSMLEAVVRIHNNQRRNPKAVVAIRGSRSGVTV